MIQAKQLISANPQFTKKFIEGSEPCLNISEFFCDTIQGEGAMAGCPAAVLRLQGCTLNCYWCDTKTIRDHGNPYTFEELYELMNMYDLIDKFNRGQHLILTGGSPLLQQGMLTNFIEEFMDRYRFKPFIEIENECTIHPNPDFVPLVDVWNNSPKLSTSGNGWVNRYHADIIKFLADQLNSWFKFVICQESDWKEIEVDFIRPQLIRQDQIILMPMGRTRKELKANKEMVVNLAIRNNVRYSSREQIVLWSDKTGV